MTGVSVIRQNRIETACRVWVWFALLSAGAGDAFARPDGAELTVRVLPQALSTNVAPLRLGLQAGLLEGPGNPFRAECFLEESAGAEGRVSVAVVPDPETGCRRFRVANEGDAPHGLALVTRTLRRNVAHTVRVSCRHVKGRGSLRFVFAPVAAPPEETTEKRVSVNGGEWVEKAFAVTPHKDGEYRCIFAVEPGSVMELSAFSLVPDDAEGGWDHQVLEALRAVSPGSLRWPVVRGLGFYNWYDGIGPRAARRAVSPTGRAEDGHDFGTVEFVGFCRRLDAEPIIRVTVFQPGMKDERVPDSAAGTQLAADWVAYCNATGRHPLAMLRSRHGQASPLGVKRWELVTAEGGAPDAAVCRAYAAAMRAEDPDVDVRAAPGLLSGPEDRYVAQVMRRLTESGLADRRYYGEWYAALGLAYAAIGRLGRGEGGDVCTALYPEQILYRVPYARNMLTESGLLLALFNRFPARVPLVTEGAPAEPESTIRVQASWTGDDSTLVIFVYNSGTESRTVRLVLSDLKRNFGFWIADQLTADITARRTAQTVPINRIQKAGAAISQVILCEAAPSSFTRVLVKQ